MKQNEKDYCVKCGREITGYVDTDLRENEIIVTYECECGCRAQQVFNLVYDRTEVLE